MMKKAIAILSAAVMTVAMAATAFAAPSPTVTGIVTAVGNGKDANGNAVEATLSEVPAEYKTVVDEIKTVEKLKEVLGDQYEEGLQVVDIKDVTVPEGTVFPITLTFTVTGVTTSSVVKVLHYDTTAGAWEVVDSKVGNGTVEATFTSLSPVAFVFDGQTVAAGTSTSPKTGETSAAGVAGVVAVAAVLGMGVLSFRRKRA